jgi:hypothetical protein
VTDLRTCTECLIEKEVAEFPFRKKRCKACGIAAHAAKKAEWYRANRQVSIERAAASRERRAGTPVKPQGTPFDVYSYYQANKPREIARSQSYRDSDRQAYRAKNWEYKLSTYDIVCARGAARRAAKLKATPTWADPEAVRTTYAKAKRLSKWTGEQMHVDHVVPLKSELVCGLHNQFNLQIIPASDNFIKSNRIWPGMW